MIYNSRSSTSEQIGWSSYDYDPVRRVTAIDHFDALAEYDYTYDAAGQITEWLHHGEDVDVTHDDAGQLTDADYTTQADEDYTYDGNGNRTGTGIVVGDNNQLLSDGTYDYEYDAEGNLILKTDVTTDDYTEYTYDHRNRMTSATTYSSTDVVLQEVEFTYDVLDRRIAKTVDADGAGSGQPETIYTVYDGQHAWADFDESEAVVARYLFGDTIDEIVARWHPTDGTAWYLTDHLGTVRDLVEADGDLINTITYDSFGNILSQTDASDGDRFTYTGREYDQELDLYYYRARYYDAQTGRFVSEDPIGFAANDANLYRYVGNSPAIFTDPMGLMEFAVSDAEVRALSAIRQASSGSSESGSIFSIVGSDAEARAMSTIRQASSGSSGSGSTFGIAGSDAEARAMSTIRQASGGSMEGGGSFSRAASDAIAQTMSTIRQASSGSMEGGGSFSRAASDALERTMSTLRQAGSSSIRGAASMVRGLSTSEEEEEEEEEVTTRVRGNSGAGRSNGSPGGGGIAPEFINDLITRGTEFISDAINTGTKFISDLVESATDFFTDLIKRLFGPDDDKGPNGGDKPPSDDDEQEPTPKVETMKGR